MVTGGRGAEGGKAITVFRRVSKKDIKVKLVL